MPDPKYISPLALEGASNPVYNIPHEKVGSRDTQLSRLTGNYYDRSFTPQFSQNDQRYDNQG